jgi:hypothetical protein
VKKRFKLIRTCGLRLWENICVCRLDIGTKTSVAAIQSETPLISVLNIFVERRISAVPIVDQEGAVVDIYAKNDAISLARDRTHVSLFALGNVFGWAIVPFDRRHQQLRHHFGRRHFF